MLKAIVFDFGGVLVRTGTPHGRREWEQNLELSPGELERIVHRSGMWIKAQRGQVSVEDYWRHVAWRLGITDSEIPALQEAYFRDDQLDHDLMSLVPELQAEGYKVGLLSNDALTLEAKLRERYEIYDAFDAVAISAKLHVMKPDAGAYRAMGAMLNIPLHECLFIDDNLANVDGARMVSMHALRFLPGMTKQDIRREIDLIQNEYKRVTVR